MKAARKRANELGIPIDTLGSGWITVEDVESKFGIVSSKFKNHVQIQNSFLNDNDENIVCILYQFLSPY